MVVAYILIKANTGEADRLLTEINAVEGIVDTHVVAGDIDLIAKVNVETPTEVKEIVANKIQRVDGVEDSETYISMD